MVGIIKLGYDNVMLHEYLQQDLWSPAIGALLVSGVTPFEGCDTTTNKMWHGLSVVDEISQARDILTLWKVQGKPEKGASPGEFLTWCITQNIDTSRLGDWSKRPAQPPLDVTGHPIPHAGLKHEESASPSGSFQQPASLRRPDIGGSLAYGYTAASNRPLPSHTAISTTPQAPPPPSVMPHQPTMPSGGTVHFNKKRIDAMDAVIKKARNNVVDCDNHHVVWQEICDMAGLDKPVKPLIGMDKGKVQWSCDGQSKFFTKNALRKRMVRLAESANGRNGR